MAIARGAEHLSATRWQAGDRLPRRDGEAALEVVEGGITAARAERDTILGARGRGERVQPNPRMRFGDAADRWLAEQVAALRPATNAIYRNAVVNHLRPRWGTRRMDAIGEAGPVERIVVGDHDTPSFAWAEHGQILSTAR
jgi:hypothetical protein